MGQIEEVFDDIKGTLGDKGWFIFVGIAVVFGLYNLVKGSGNSEDNLVPVRTVSSYPDTVTNANVIIDTLQNSIEYSENEIKDYIGEINDGVNEQLSGMETNLGEKIESLGSSLGEKIDTGFEVTNDYINTGLESQKNLMDNNFDELYGTLGSLSDRVDDYKDQMKDISSNQSSLEQSFNQMEKDLTNSMGSIVSSAVNTAIKNSSSSSSSTKKTTSSSSSSTKKTKSNTYTYKTKSGLKTNTSIVDALKATGVNSSFENRAKIAKANGISNYKGTTSQNTTLLNKLKAGKLKKV